MNSKNIFGLFLILAGLYLPFGLTWSFYDDDEFRTISTNEKGERIDWKDKYNHYLGLAAGTGMGCGLTYRYWAKDWGYQLVFSPIYNTGTDYLNLGAALFRRLGFGESYRTFVYVGGDVGYYKLDNIDRNYSQKTNDTTYTYSTNTIKDFYTSLSAGFGAEIFLFWNISAYGIVGAGVGYDYDFQKFEPRFSGKLNIDIGILYRWL